MKKEKWLLREIDKWQSEEIISAETAETLKKRYEQKKNIGFMIVLFSVIGTLFIGMGVILIGANNWWYKLPVAVRTVIAFLPIILSQMLLFYVYKRKMHSTAFRESAAILNMAGVFSSIAIVGQIFHLPGDFTNYVLTCGILSFIPMVAMRAVSPVIIYYWTVMNGGIYASREWGLLITVILFAAGAAFAVYNFRSENGKAVYLSWLTVLAGFIVMIMASLWDGCDPILILLAYFILLLTTSYRWDKAGIPLRITGTAGVLILFAVTTYEGIWQYSADIDDGVYVGIVAVMTVAAAIFFAKRFIGGKRDMFSAIALAVLAMRIVWACAGLDDEPFDMIFMILLNIIMFAVGVIFIWSGTKNVNLLYANVGMVTVCTLIIMRFFDSEMSLALRGVAFLVIGIGFLLFNLRLIRIKKTAKEEAV